MTSVNIYQLQSNNKKKICIVVSSLGKGGAEKSSALLSVMLDNLGFEVHIVSVLNDVDYQYAGKLLNLGELKDKDDTFLGRYKRYSVFKKYLKSEQFDIIIDSRSRPTTLKELQISKNLYASFKVVYVVHSYNLDIYFSRIKWFSKFIYKNSHRLIAVSNDIKNKIEQYYQFNNVNTIYNAVDVESNKKLAQNPISLNYDFVLFYGRLDDDVKNISLLIEAYKNSKLPQEKIKLVILGDGRDKDRLQSKVKSEDLLDSVVFLQFTNNPFQYISRAKFTLLTSRFEGFPMVIPESLSVGTPVISVDCKSGPSEIIKHEFNGLLVENNNVQALSNAMNSFIFDNSLYLKCKQNAEDSIEHLSIENIEKQWSDLLNS